MLIKRLVQFFLNAYPVQSDLYPSVRTQVICMMMLTPVLLLCLAVGVANPLIRGLFYIMVGLNCIILFLIRSGAFKPANLFMLVGYGIAATASVFSLDNYTPHEVYMLGCAHLFLLFTVTLISYETHHVYISASLATATFWAHYLFRELPLRADQTLVTAGLDDYLVVTGLMLISAVIITNTLKTKAVLISKLQKSAGENEKKADQMSDIYEDLLRVVAEREEMEQKYRLLLETATDAIFIAQDGVIKFSNHRTVEIFGYSIAELASTPFTQIIHQDDREMVARRHQERLGGGTPPPAYTFRGVNKQGETRWVQIHSVTTTWEKRPATLNFMQDITDHKLMEHQIQQSQKIEAIGTLAGGIAHDFNNILSGIFAYLQLAQNHVNQPEKVLRDIQQIRLGAEKAADLSRQILMVSRKSDPKKETFVMADGVQEVLGLMRATLPPTIELAANLETRAAALADPGKIHQVIMNLCTNAAQAMPPSGGTIEVGLTETQVAQDPGLNGRGIPPGNYLCLMVKDSGAGMDLATQEKIFDPYFTTKEPGKGTGLGLAVVMGIVQEHGGYIRLHSEKGKGSEFQIFFPMTTANDTSAAPRESRPLPPGKGQILYVDDEENLCLAISSLLEEQGYTVTCCRDGQSAWQTFEASPGRFDLVLTDHTMPAMTGSELIRRIKAVSPGTPTILCSGNTAMLPEEERKAATAYLPKPVDAGLLLETVHQVTSPLAVQAGTDQATG